MQYIRRGEYLLHPQTEDEPERGEGQLAVNAGCHGASSLLGVGIVLKRITI